MPSVLASEAATSLADLAGGDVDRVALLRRLLDALETELEAIEAGSSPLERYLVTAGWSQIGACRAGVLYRRRAPVPATDAPALGPDPNRVAFGCIFQMRRGAAELPAPALNRFTSDVPAMRRQSRRWSPRAIS